MTISMISSGPHPVFILILLLLPNHQHPNRSKNQNLKNSRTNNMPTDDQPPPYPGNINATPKPAVVAPGYPVQPPPYDGNPMTTPGNPMPTPYAQPGNIYSSLTLKLMNSHIVDHTVVRKFIQAVVINSFKIM